MIIIFFLVIVTMHNMNALFSVAKIEMQLDTYISLRLKNRIRISNHQRIRCIFKYTMSDYPDLLF